MRKWLYAGALLLTGVLFATLVGPGLVQALAPAQVNGCQYLASPPTLSDQQTSVIQCDNTGNIKTSGGGGAASPFAPTGAASLAVTSVTGNVALPNNSAILVVQNSGTTNGFFNLGVGNGTTATVSNYSIPAGYQICVAVGANTYLAGITAASTTTYNLIQGSGSCPTLSGGGGGGGSGGASTRANAADPNYVEGSTGNPLSQNLTGYQRVILPASQVLTAGTSAAPSTQLVSSTLVPSSGSGCTPGKTITANTTNATNKTAAVTTLCWLNATYTGTGGAVAGWVKIIDKSSAPTCGTDTVVQSVPVAQAPAAGSVGGIIPGFGPYGLAFANGFSFCVTLNEADNDTTAVAANIMINYGYK